MKRDWGKVNRRYSRNMCFYVSDALRKKWASLLMVGWRAKVLRTFVVKCVEERLYPDDYLALMEGRFSLRSAIDEYERQHPDDPPA